jgi:hypothetical protein
MRLMLRRGRRVLWVETSPELWASPNLAYRSCHLYQRWCGNPSDNNFFFWHYEAWYCFLASISRYCSSKQRHHLPSKVCFREARWLGYFLRPSTTQRFKASQHACDGQRRPFDRLRNLTILVRAWPTYYNRPNVSDSLLLWPLKFPTTQLIIRWLTSGPLTAFPSRYERYRNATTRQRKRHRKMLLAPALGLITYNHFQARYRTTYLWFGLSMCYSRSEKHDFLHKHCIYTVQTLVTILAPHFAVITFFCAYDDDTAESIHSFAN